MKLETLREISANPEYLDAARVLRLISDNGMSMKHQDLLRKMQHMNAEKFNKLIASLIAAKMI